MKWRVLVSAPYFIPVIEDYRERLSTEGVELIPANVNERLSEEELLECVGDIDGIICGDDRITGKVMDAAPRLKVISKWGTGIDSIDSKAAAQMGVKVCNTPNAFTLPVSDSVMGYILAFARMLPWMDQAVKSGVWGKIPGRSLSECTLGVIGVGNVGKAVIRRARAFGMKLLATDIIAIAPDFILENGVEMTTLQSLLERADFVSVNCDLNPTSYHLINTDTLSWMKKDAIVINTARGPIVDEQAIIAALQDRWIGGAALDVFEFEPLPKDSPFLKMSNVMLASHNANSSPSAWERVHYNTIRMLLDGLGIGHDDFDTVYPGA